MNDSKNTEYFIITRGYNRGKCENPNAPNCGQSDQLLWLKAKRKPRLFDKNKLYICAKCAKKDFKLVGEWAKSWEKEFKVYKPNE